jgi:cytochrome P450
MKLTLHVIFAAGYGRRFEWEQSDELCSGHEMSFRGSLRTVIDNIPVFMFISEAWRKILPFKYLRTLEQSFSESNQYFKEFIALEKQEKPSNNGIRTILGLLVEDTADTDLQKGDILPEKEIIGNAFIFLLAGHETTYASFRRVQINFSANVLLYSLYLLAMHPSVQDEMFQEVNRVCGDNPPQFTDFQSLTYLLCVMYETLRLFPFSGFVAQMPDKDQMLLGKHWIPKDTVISFDFVNTQRNEKFWGDNANEFIPSRFDNRNPEAESSNPRMVTYMDGKIKFPAKGTFIIFGDGPRACLGISSMVCDLMCFIREAVCGS